MTVVFGIWMFLNFKIILIVFPERLFKSSSVLLTHLRNKLVIKIFVCPVIFLLLTGPEEALCVLHCLTRVTYGPQCACLWSRNFTLQCFHEFVCHSLQSSLLNKSQTYLLSSSQYNSCSWVVVLWRNHSVLLKWHLKWNQLLVVRKNNSCDFVSYS